MTAAAAAPSRIGRFDRAALPDPVHYFEGEGLPLTGRGAWRTTACPLHGGSDSLRVNVEAGAWRCMACGATGGDVLAFHQQRHGQDFVDAARALGAWLDDPHGGRNAAAVRRPAFTARDALACLRSELLIAFVVASDVRSGVVPEAEDWTRFLQAVGRIETVAAEYAA